MPLNKDSNAYIIGFAAAVCVVCSIFVSGAAVSLKDKQIENAKLDLQKNVISVAFDDVNVKEKEEGKQSAKERDNQGHFHRIGKRTFQDLQLQADSF